MPDRTVTLLCTAHRRRVIKGAAEGVLEHLGGNVDRYCSSQRFVLRWEETADRDTALAVLAGEDGDRGR